MGTSFKYKLFRSIAIFLVVNIAFQLFYPLRALALTSGPSQPEVQSFEAVVASEMVDLFTGDFTYNIPMFELPGPNGGYPFNLHYNSNVSMDQESSWTGLGWNISPGAVNRQMRGLPDEFKGDNIVREQDIRPNTTFGVGVGGNVEAFGGDFFKGKFTLGIGLYYNNYKGVGYSIDPGVSLMTNSKGGGDVGLGFNLSMDSQEGIGVRPSLSLLSHGENNESSLTFGGSYNSKRGLTGASMGFTYQGKDNQNPEKATRKEEKEKEENEENDTRTSFGGTANLAVVSQAYSPQVSMPMQGRNFSLNIKTGGSIFGVFGNGYVSGFFNTQYLKNRKASAPAFGYMFMEEANNSDEVMLDFNREKDGTIYKNSPNLPSPGLTYDIYTVTGQGISGMYRPYRSDIGMVYDKYMESETFGVAGGFDAGVGMPHIGGDLTISYAKSSSGRWKNDNPVNDILKFVKATDPTVSKNKHYEPFYFKTHGEHTTDTLAELNYIGGSEPVKINLASNLSNAADIKYPAEKSLETASRKKVPTSQFSNTNPIAENAKNTLDNREPRNLVVQPISNTDLTNDQEGANKEILKEYRVDYFPSTAVNKYQKAQETDYIRRVAKKSHTAGFTATNPDGSRYVYGLPAYNNEQIECQFSVLSEPACSSVVKIKKGSIDATKPVYDTKEFKNTDKYYNRTSVPDFAHSFLLTSILGADYVDADNIAGPSDGDFGYWVKFSYVKVNEDYKWRVPYNGAHYNKGYNSTPWDDKGAYTYGTKETWYLAKAETKTHVSVFNISKRMDGRGAKRELQNEDETDRFGAYQYKLDSIEVFTRNEFEKTSNKLALQKVHFRYTYDLCPKVHNNNISETEMVDGVNINSKGGKLTLKKVWFTYENNLRGAVSPYEFNYNENVAEENPEYHTHKYDRWGNYKPEGNMCDNLVNPYVDQNSSASSRNTNIAVWNLKSITLPSGGDIGIKYEADDYAYVQNKAAMQMFKIESMSSGVNQVSTVSHNNKKAYFKLEQAIVKKTGVENTEAEKLASAEVDKRYNDGTGKVFFKAFMKVRKTTDLVQEYVSGYANAEKYGVDPDSEVNGSYTRGFVEFSPVIVNGKALPYHPFSVAAWQHIRTNQPQLAQVGNFNSDPDTDEGQAEAKIRSLISIAGEISKIFKGFYDHANGAGWGRELDLSKSFIRLNTPDRIKYGGGTRVKEVVLKDDWYNSTGSKEEQSVYGQVYDYSMVDNGETISSGVASYEPLIGGEEIALRYSKGFSEEIPFMTPNNLFFELPINENYYPSPVVGYRKVTVKSLATHYADPSLNTTATDPYSIPSGIMTTGAAVHEFYTAKEFPVVAKETEAEKKPFDLFVPIPLLGQITVNNLTASQGYSIELNDMHGKLKKVSHYQQDASGNIIPEAVSWIQYNYKVTPKPSEKGRGEDHFVLDNKVETLVSDKNGNVIKSTRFIGQDYEFVTDMRESRTSATSGGLTLNTDVLFIGPFPLPTFMPWPNVGSSVTQLRTAVTNKIIHKSGIVISTEAYDGGSLVKTDNVLFDALTGQPVLTTVTNNYEEPVYNYNLPAHLVYDGMGPAYSNIGLRFNAPITVDDAINKIYSIDISAATSVPWELLVPGDEFIINTAKGVFIRKESNNLKFLLETSINGGSYNFYLTRSGKKNHLSSTASTITALSDPTKNRVNEDCEKIIKVPSFTLMEVEDSFELAPCEFNLIRLFNDFNNTGETQTNAPIDTSKYKLCSFWRLIRKDWNNELIGISDDYVGKAIQYYLYGLADKNGNKINWDNISLINSPAYCSYTPAKSITVKGINLYPSKVSAKVLLKDLNTTITAYFYSSNFKSFTLLPVKAQVATLKDEIIKSDSYKINNVLSASASTMSDNWYYDLYNSTNRDANENTFVLNPAHRSWKSSGQYVYVDKRKQSSLLNLSKDGGMDKVPLFGYNTGMFTECNPAWRLTSQTTQYNPDGNEIENMDILNVFSSALYAHKGKYASAVSNNARVWEIGAEGFEEYGTSVSPTTVGAGNIHIFTSVPQTELFSTQSVGGYGVLSHFIIDKPYNPNYTITEVFISADEAYKTGSNGMFEKIYFAGRLKVTKHQPYYIRETNGNTKLVKDRSVIVLEADPNSEVKWLKGKGVMTTKTSTNAPKVTIAPANNVAIATTFAHTGSQSLKVAGSGEFEQKRLELSYGKKYFFSTWVNINNIRVSTYQSSSTATGDARLYVNINFLDHEKAVIGTATFEPSGPIIEGWQKIEGEFSVPEQTSTISLKFNSGMRGTTYSTAYFDDIRIHPKEASMKTYVYTKSDLKLKAILDDNNFASLYFYDASGRLYLVQKETERGIMTLQESFSFQKKR